MSDPETRSKRFQKRMRNVYAKELEKHQPKTFKSIKDYKRENLKPRDIDEIIESLED